jgi:hypothetical protein
VAAKPSPQLRPIVEIDAHEVDAGMDPDARGSAEAGVPSRTIDDLGITSDCPSGRRLASSDDEWLVGPDWTDVEDLAQWAEERHLTAPPRSVPSWPQCRAAGDRGPVVCTTTEAVQKGGGTGLEWFRALDRLEVFAIDGKVLRRSFEMPIGLHVYDTEFECVASNVIAALRLRRQGGVIVVDEYPNRLACDAPGPNVSSASSDRSERFWAKNDAECLQRICKLRGKYTFDGGRLVRVEGAVRQSPERR